MKISTIKELCDEFLSRVESQLDDQTVIDVPSNVNYLSDFMNDLPHNAYINKGITGCGGTTLAITNDQNYVIAVHSVNIIKNKSNQHKNLCPVYSETTDDDIINYIKNNNGPKKFMVTYDSIPRLIKSISSTDYRLLVDESHILIRYLGHFKTSVCHALLESAYKFKSTSFLTATPTPREFLPLPMKKLDYVELNWKNTIKPDIKHMYCGRQLQTKVVLFINEKLNETDDEIYIFYNSKNGVLASINKLMSIRDDITIDDINIIFSDTDENRKFFRTKLKSKTMSIGADTIFDENGKPVKGHNKRINFISSFGFEGIDFYTHGKNVITLVVADPLSKSMRYDISIDMPQILGRFRRDKDSGLFPRNDIYFIWRSMSTEVEFDDLNDLFSYVANMTIYGRQLNDIGNITHKKAIKDISSTYLRAHEPYLIKSDNEEHPNVYIENIYALEGILSVYSSTNIDYHILVNDPSNIEESFISNSLTSISSSNDTFTIKQITNEQSMLLNREVPFSKIASQYYDLILEERMIGSDKLKINEFKSGLLQMSDDLTEYLEYLDIDTMAKYSFWHTKIKEEYEIKRLKTVLHKYGFVTGAKINYKELPILLKQMYTDNNIEKNPKRTILKLWFKVNDRAEVNGIRHYHLIDKL